jgi:hypothetical protein
LYSDFLSVVKAAMDGEESKVLKTHPYDIEAAESSLAGVDDTA